MNEPLLLAKGIHKTYFLGQRALEVLRGVDVELRRGDFLAVRGASGAGKSTLLHLLGGLDAPTEGEIQFGGRNLATLPRRGLARMRHKAAGHIFKHFYLLPELRRGDFLAVRGASGAGKSTLLHLLGGLDAPTEGEIQFGGRN